MISQSFRRLSTAFTGRSVAVAMSGGVDSTVAAYLMASQGFNVTGIFMQNWDEVEETGQCTADQDYKKVVSICNHLDIPSRRVRFVKDYWNDVFRVFLAEYERGITPNPDVLCNSQIKFGSLLSVIEKLGYDFLATGHYARLDNTEPTMPRLLRAQDAQKDQTYFLAAVPGLSFRKVVFPVGKMLKCDVKDLVRQIGLGWVSRQKESMGLCFVGKRKFADFIESYLDHQPGKVVDLSGRVLGQHLGLFFYTIGQRARVGGLKEAHYVVDKDVGKNCLVVVSGSNHPALFQQEFTVGPVNWIGRGSCWKSRRCKVRVRHTGVLLDCSVEEKEAEDCQFTVTTSQPVRAVTPGQYAVFYSDDECLGGAVITHRKLSLAM
eukprot:m.22521 g.22521  ORF g.22521 m.22521 type:complete len:377 (+) comp28347_c0_seq4:3-1133(+)